MKAIAKHDCSINLTLSLNSLSLNFMSVHKGQVIEFPVYQDNVISGPLSAYLGERSIVFQDGVMLLPTYSKDFDYID